MVAQGMRRNAFRIRFVFMGDTAWISFVWRFLPWGLAVALALAGPAYAAGAAASGPPAPKASAPLLDVAPAVLGVPKAGKRLSIGDGGKGGRTSEPAQPPTAPQAATGPAPRSAAPRICLALSGGGARGLAHIGVLMALRALRVPVDCIAGTSMGAIVGGLYAAGVPLAVLRQQVGGLDWKAVFRGRPPREGLDFQRKSDDVRMPGGIELGINDHGQVSLPDAAVNSTALETVLTNLTLQTRSVHDFDALPIPFRAVATNMVNGRKVVLDQGDLATALRASMSVPGVFPPIEVQGALLGDGGLVDNMPIDVARAMGAQAVIAVNISRPLSSREALGSIVGVTGQMINILMEQNVTSQIKTLTAADVLITPDLGSISSVDFDKGEQALRDGYAATMAAAPQLERYALSEQAYRAWRIRVDTHAQELVAGLAQRPLVAVRVEGSAWAPGATLEANLSQKAGQPLRYADVHRDLDWLAGLGDFSRVDYRLVRDGEGDALDYRVTDKPWGPNFLRFGLGLSTDLRNQTRFELQLIQRRPWLNSLGGEWRNFVQLGWENRWTSELYQPLNRVDSVFLAPYLDLDSHPIDVYAGNQPIDRYRLTTSRVGLDVGTPVSDYGELRLGYSLAQISANTILGASNLSGSVREAGIRALAVFDRLDHAYFPREGWRARLETFSADRRLGSAANYVRLDLSGQYDHSFGRQTLEAAAHVASFRDISGTGYNYFSLGGFDQLSGFREGQIIGNYLAYFRLGMRTELTTAGLFGGATYAGISLERGNAWAQRDQASLRDLRSSLALYLGADTPLGPVYFGLGKAPGQTVNFYLMLGRP